MTGSAQVTGSLTMSGSISIPDSGSGITISSGSLNVKRSAESTNIATFILGYLLKSRFDEDDKNLDGSL